MLKILLKNELKRNPEIPNLKQKSQVKRKLCNENVKKIFSVNLLIVREKNK